MNETDLYRAARRRVAMKIGFYIHLVVYLAVNVLLRAINLATTPDTLWFLWPLLGWGIGVVCHGLAVFLLPSLGAARDRMVQREAERMMTSR